MRITKGIQVTGSSKRHYWPSDSPNNRDAALSPGPAQVQKQEDSLIFPT